MGRCGTAALATSQPHAATGVGITAGPWLAGAGRPPPRRSGVWSWLRAGGLDAAVCSEGPAGITLSSARALRPLM